MLGHRLRRVQSRLHRSLATYAPLPTKDTTNLIPPYPALYEKLIQVRRILGNDRPLSLAEKILYSHLHDPEASLSGGGRIRGDKYLQLKPQRVAMQDASAQYAFTRVFFLPWV
jgi:homoaconitase